MYPFFLLLCLMTMSCGGKGQKSPEKTVTDITPLIKKFVVYKELTREYANQFDGFVSDSCDSLLFSGLYAATDSSKVDLSLALDESGKWHRRPLSLGPCYPDNSGSEISRDMFIGLFWGIWRAKNLSLAEQIAEYGEANNWIMGEGDVSRTALSPALASTLYKMIASLGGKRHESKEIFPIVFDKVKGFEAHLQVLHMLLRAQIDGGAEPEYIKAFKYHAERQPENALFQAAYHRYEDGDYSVPMGVLMDETHWPINRLPDGREHCEFWLWQRDNGDDWEPCDAPKHSGADWIFAYQVIRGYDDN